MREILFRGKRIDGGEWVYGDFQLSSLQCFIIERGTGIKYKVVPEMVGQYTGLTDKNDKKIFEGDIVEYRYEFGEIAYSDGEAMFIIEFDTWYTDFDHLYSIRLEVIGNIHDNSELLGGGAE